MRYFKGLSDNILTFRAKCFALFPSTPSDGSTLLLTKNLCRLVPASSAMKCLQGNLKAGDAGLSKTHKLAQAESLLLSFPAPASCMPKVV